MVSGSGLGLKSQPRSGLGSLVLSGVDQDLGMSLGSQSQMVVGIRQQWGKCLGWGSG